MEDITGHTFNGEVFIQGSDKSVGRFENDVKIKIVGNGAAGNQRGQSCAFAAAQAFVHHVVVKIGAPAPVASGETVGQHGYDFIELAAGEVTVRISVAK